MSVYIWFMQTRASQESSKHSASEGDVHPYLVVKVYVDAGCAQSGLEA